MRLDRTRLATGKRSPQRLRGVVRRHRVRASLRPRVLLRWRSWADRLLRSHAAHGLDVSAPLLTWLAGPARERELLAARSVLVQQKYVLYRLSPVIDVHLRTLTRHLSGAARLPGAGGFVAPMAMVFREQERSTLETLREVVSGGALRLDLRRRAAVAASPARTMRFVVRMVARGQSAASQTQPGHSMSRVPPVERVFSRPAAPGAPFAAPVQEPRFDAPPGHAPDFERSPQRADSTWQPRPGGVGVVLAPSQVDVEQLTDRVIRSIDRRLVSAKERLGMV